MTHLCVGNLSIIGSDNGLPPGRRCWDVVNWTLKNKLQWNFSRSYDIFIQENVFEAIVCEMAAILSRPQCVNMCVCAYAGYIYGPLVMQLGCISCVCNALANGHLHSICLIGTYTIGYEWLWQRSSAHNYRLANLLLWFIVHWFNGYVIFPPKFSASHFDSLQVIIAIAHAFPYSSHEYPHVTGLRPLPPTCVDDMASINIYNFNQWLSNHTFLKYKWKHHEYLSVIFFLLHLHLSFFISNFLRSFAHCDCCQIHVLIS